MSQTSKLDIAFGGVIFAGIIALSGWAWGQLPETVQIAVHFDWTGAGDTYVDKLNGLCVMPFLTLGLLVILVLIPALDRARRWTLQLTFALFAIVHALIVAKALGSTINVTNTMLPLVPAFLLAVLAFQSLAHHQNQSDL
jgi:uncharacterized membrane protein